MTPNNKVSIQANERQSLVGVDKYLKAATIMVLGTSYTPTQIKMVIQAHLDAAAATQTARAAWQVAVETERKAHTVAHGVLVGLRSFLIMQYGKAASDVLADFGFVPPKVVKRTPATKVAATVKSLATRKARKTLGKKQRIAIKGVNPATPTAVPAHPQASDAAPPR